MGALGLGIVASVLLAIIISDVGRFIIFLKRITVERLFKNTSSKIC
jgi:hypothetical protein